MQNITNLIFKIGKRYLIFVIIPLIITLYSIVGLLDIILGICKWNMRSRGGDLGGSIEINCPIGFGWFENITHMGTSFLGIELMQFLFVLLVLWGLLIPIFKFFSKRELTESANPILDHKEIQYYTLARRIFWLTPVFIIAVFFIIHFFITHQESKLREAMVVHRIDQLDALSETPTEEGCPDFPEMYLTKKYGAVTRDALGDFISSSSRRNRRDYFILHLPNGFFDSKGYIVLSPKNSWNGEDTNCIDGFCGNHFGDYFSNSGNPKEIIIPSPIIIPSGKYDVRFFRIPDSSVTIGDNHHAIVESFDSNPAKIFPNNTDCATINIR